MTTQDIIANLAMIKKLKKAASVKLVEGSWFSLLNDRQNIVSQAGFRVGCGYAAMLNSLLLNTSAVQVFEKLSGSTDLQRLRQLQKRYGYLPSTNHKKGRRHRDDGLIAEDLLAIYNEIRADFGLSSLGGCALERRVTHGECHKAHAERIHRLLVDSLMLGEAPILTARSQAIVNAKCVRLMGHYVTVAEMQKCPNKDGSFLIGYLDSEDGRSHVAFVYPDPRGFAAYSGHDDQKTFLPDGPYLALAGSEICLKTEKQPVSRRTVIYIDHAIVAHNRDHQSR